MFRLAIFIIVIIIGTLTFVGVRRFQSKPSISPTPSATGGPEAQIMTQEKLIEKRAKEKLAQHLGIEESHIEVVKTEKVDWPDASLGAPEEGMMYAQVIMPGYKVTMMAGSIIYETHTDLDGRQVVLVQNGKRLK